MVNMFPLPYRKLILAVSLLVPLFAHAQKVTDSLDRLIAKAKTDTARINLLNEKTSDLIEINLDSAAVNGRKTLAAAIARHYPAGQAAALRQMATIYCFKGDYGAAEGSLRASRAIAVKLGDLAGLAKIYSGYGMLYGMQSKYDSSIIALKKAVGFATAVHDEVALGRAYQNMAISYQMQSNYTQSLVYFQKALRNAEIRHDVNSQSYIVLNMGLTYDNMEDDSRAEQALKKALKLARIAGIKNVETYAYSNLAALYDREAKYALAYSFAMKAVALGKATGDLGITAASLSKAIISLDNLKRLPEALRLGMQSLALADSSHQPYNIFQVYTSVGKVLKDQHQYARALPYLEKAFSVMKAADLTDEGAGTSYADLSECYAQTGKYQLALTAYKRSAQIADSIHSSKNIRKATEQTMNYEFDIKQQAAQVEKQQQAAANKVKVIIFIAVLAVFLGIAIVLVIAYRNKQRANALLEKTLDELRTTQQQLIQSEKMASLGELTAGIAHEIQNPLNFVNNFAEVSVELLGELREEAAAGHTADVIAIAGDLGQNLEKINHHGKRADAIVKSMLQHSRTSSDVKGPADINKLTDEYLRLAYHGMRAKDKSFHAELITDLAVQLPVINVAAQDIGRALLNLFNNAFYTVKEKQMNAGEDYKPTISVSTKLAGKTISIRIADNGMGVPGAIKDKIFQPFFTTKPTGDATGLGLSLTYDIVVKGHGGKIELDSTIGEGSVFTISLPV
jgi:two-component system NtrC family sensor kinase